MPSVDPVQQLRRFALSLADVDQGVACEGTALEKITFRTGGKAFLFLSRQDAMVKLVESLEDAQRRAKEEPKRLKVGKTGWATQSFGDGLEPADRARLERWILESHRAMQSSGRPRKPRAARVKVRSPAQRRSRS